MCYHQYLADAIVLELSDCRMIESAIYPISLRKMLRHTVAVVQQPDVRETSLLVRICCDISHGIE